jgi:hypothetical protein
MNTWRQISQACGTSWSARRAGRMRSLLLIALLAVVLLLVGCDSGYSGGGGSGGGGHGGDTSNIDYVARYCKYGAVSRAQLNECERNVGVRYVDSLGTNAARFARGQLSRCLGDSGPFCQGVLDQEKADYYGSMGG